MNATSDRERQKRGSPSESSSAPTRPFAERPFGPKADPFFASSAVVPESVRATITSPGRPLDSGTREIMEARLGHDFSRVRIHTDTRAGESASAVQALAYAVGGHIAFAPDLFAPETDEGRQLLAHELVHTVQQRHLPANPTNLTLESASDSPLEREADRAAQFAASGRPPAAGTLASFSPSSARTAYVARKKVAGYETKPVDFERADIENLVGVSYWEQKVGSQYDITFVNAVADRFKADEEEKSAVLSVLWQRRPAGALKAEEIITVSIPPRAGAPQSKALLYRFTFRPVAKGAPKGALQTVGVDFVAEGTRATVTAAPTTPAAYTAPELSVGASDFPDGMGNYWTKHPEEKKQLYRWIENASGPKFDQIVTTSTPLPAGKKHETSYQITGTKPPAGKVKVDIKYLSETAIGIETPVTGYAAKDFADIRLDEQQASETKGGKLGSISGLSAVPADEALSVKYTVGQYFARGTRNTEVDVIIPIAKKTTSVLYTLRFLPASNDVEIERVGEAGSSVALTATALNITRVAGFAANSTDATAFKKWIQHRYPGVTPTGATLAELQASVNAALAANAGTAAWFATNYGIEILDPTTAATRLTAVHQRPSPQLKELKAFSADDLQRLEFSLEAMGDAALKTIRGTRMIRQATHLELVGKPPAVVEKRDTAGFTLQHGTDKTILIYDSATGNENRLFIGGAAGVRPSSVGTFVHEFGHVIERQGNLAASFSKFVRAQGIAPLTWYAQSEPVTESFPEAFFVFQSDPEWMRSNLPALFTWLDAVNKTGAPPPP